jgi:hypothetical protein
MIHSFMATLDDLKALESRVLAIEHASRSLALARELILAEQDPAIPHGPIHSARLRAEVSRVARLLEEIGDHKASTSALEGAAEALDRELHALV